jgi:hypothetical protein
MLSEGGLGYLLDEDDTRCVSLSIEKKDYSYSPVAITSLDRFV